MAVAQKNSKIIIGENVFGRLAPLQQKIVLELAIQPLTLDELSKRTGSSVYTIGKQLSLLQLKTKYNPLPSKGISIPLVKKQKEAGIRTTYSLLAESLQAKKN